MTEKSYISLRDLYIERLVPSIEDIKNTLKDYFGEDRFDFKVIKDPNFLSFLNSKDRKDTEANRNFINNSFKKTQVDCSTYYNKPVYIIHIYFPFLTVRNSQNLKDNIEDLYIRIRLSPFLNAITNDYGIYFEGIRTTFSARHWNSNYNFSHMALGANQLVFSKFCLGSTDFSVLCNSLHCQHESNNFNLYCQQLKDYLSWESLEGVPYKKMGDIRTVDSQSVSITSSQLNSYFISYLSHDFMPDFKIEQCDTAYIIKVDNNDRFKEFVTSLITNENHFQSWNSETKTYFNRNSGGNVDVDYIMRNNSNVLLTFKGKDIKLIVKNENVVVDNNQRVAHSSIINHILNEINKKIEDVKHNEFSKQERSYTSR